MLMIFSAHWGIYFSEQFLEWQHDLLYAILSAQLLALFAMVSFCISQAESAHKSATKFFSIAVTIAGIFSNNILQHLNG